MKKAVCLFIFLFTLSAGKAQVPDKSWWTFSYPNNRSLDSGLLNLRYLNEHFAGQNGFIKLSADGNSFANSKNKEVRFWACNGGSLANGFDDKKLDSELDMGGMKMPWYDMISFTIYREANMLGQLALWRRLLNYPALKYD